MTHTDKFKNLIILLSLALLLPAGSCTKTDISTLDNNITCYAATYNKGVYKSDNGGISWYPLVSNQDDLYLYSKKLFLNPDNKRLYISTTGGGIFFVDMEKGTLNSLTAFRDEDIRSVAFRNAPNGQGNSIEILVGKKDTGIYKSIEGSDNWEQSNNGLTYRDVNTLFTKTGNLYAGTINGLFKWDEASKMWLVTSEGIKNKNIIAIDADPQGKTIYAGAGVNQNGKGRFEDIPSLYKSTDNGKTWEAADKGLPDDVLVYCIAVNPLKPERIYLGTSDGIYRSTDSGKKWTKMEGGLPKKLRILDIRIAHMSDGKDQVYAAGANGLFVAQDDETPKWVSRSYGLEKTYFSGIALQTN